VPPRDASKTQLDFPLLVADLINQLNLTGTIGVLDFLPVVTPTFIVGSRGLEVTSERVVYAPAETFFNNQVNPAAAAVGATTGALPAGDYDLEAHISVSISAGGPATVRMQQRNAADAATVAQWGITANVGDSVAMHIPLSLRLADLERIRIENITAFTGQIAASLTIRIRPAP